MAPQTDFVLQYETGDVVEQVEDGGVLVHACNCLGAWGSGIALQLKQQFPNAYVTYHTYCQDRTPEQLMGTCLFIPPHEIDQKSSSRKDPSMKKVWIACLFTSKGYGRKNARNGNPGLSKKGDVMIATEKALNDFHRQLSDFDLGEGDGRVKPGRIASVKFNAGSFKVPWEETEDVIEKVFEDSEHHWVVVSGG